MDYKRIESTIVLRLDPGEEICGSLLKLAAEEGIQLAEISGLGAVNEFTTGVFDTQKKEYHANHFTGPYEIVSLTGTLTRKMEEPYLHLHMSAGDSKGAVVGGHLNRAIISATAEIIVSIIPGKISREFDDLIGLNLLSF